MRDPKQTIEQVFAKQDEMFRRAMNESHPWTFEHGIVAGALAVMGTWIIVALLNYL